MFKLLYFQNETCYLAILTLQFDDVTVETIYTCHVGYFRLEVINLYFIMQGYQIRVPVRVSERKLKLRPNHHNFKEMILEIKVMIAKFDHVIRATTAKKPAKKCVVHSEFLFSSFSYFCCCGSCTELASTVTM